MEIMKDRVAVIHYRLKRDDGEVIDSSHGSEPLAYLHGNGNLVPGLEKALEGKQPGDRFEVSVTAAEGYGKRDPNLVKRVPRRALGKHANIVKGAQLQMNTDLGTRVFTVTAVLGDMITLDGNHELADTNLNFEIEIVEVRDASEEELEHGHVHGPGGHHH